ncbi:MAG: hypothetical protein DI535_07040 [Citrobacter freundii]|nr:MAG: hypothetical protein DI535_07040 [Citrobacter freundii]
MKKAYFFLSLLFLLSCSVQQKTSAYIRNHASLADSLLATALDNEALYSVLDTIKPISSILSLRYKVNTDSLARPGTSERIDTVVLYQQLCRALSNDHVTFVAVPFRDLFKGEKTIEIYAVNLLKLKSKVREYSSFFTLFGITPESDPAQVITIIENAAKYERWRGYGYLFGYPDYAVDFFVDAGKSQDSTSKFVTRDFFQIPVYAAAEGHFTYAIPKGHQPGPADSTLYHQAVQTLDRYSEMRSKYVSARGMRALALWKDWQNKQ